MKFKRIVILSAIAVLFTASCQNQGKATSSAEASSQESSATSVPVETSESSEIETSEPVETSEVTPSEEPSEEPSKETSEIFSSDSVVIDTTYKDLTSASVFGTISDFSIPVEEVKVGDYLTFKVTPREDYLISRVTVNGVEIEPLNGEVGRYGVYLVEGENDIAAYYKVDASKDYLDSFKLNLTKKEYYNLMHNNKGEYGKTNLDFRQDGYELMCLPTNGPDGFMNIVDGDTTHFSTMNYGYTVKVRYLGIDTPESTSELEEWGKTASNYSKALFKSAKWVMLQSQAKASGIPQTDDEHKDHPWSSSTDGNGRNLAFVWYTTVEEPEINDWKCVNLEMVAQGFSNSTLALSSAGEYFYFAFDKANRKAVEEKLHIHSEEKDENYFYYDPTSPYYDGEVQKITIKELYTSTPNYESSRLQNVDDEKPETYTPYIDGKTLYRVEGYISRKIGYAFYIQDKPSYEEGDSLPEAYGLYVFTYSAHPFKEGDHVSLCGIFSIYGGSYQMQGISYSAFSPDEIRDAYFVRKEDGSRDRGNNMVPIEMSVTEFNTKKYDGVLVSVDNKLTCKTKPAGGGYVMEYGGSHEVDSYNKKYPTYNSSNKIVFYGWSGTESLRITQDADCLVRYGVDTAYTFKFYIGGEFYYYPDHPEYISDINQRAEHMEDPDMIHISYKQKEIYMTGVSTNYISTSKSASTKCYQINLTAMPDITIDGEVE